MDTLPSKSKRCTKCDKLKPISKFYRNKASPDGYRPDCKACENTPAKKRDITATFWSKVNKGLPDECWNWQASTATNNGYGRFWLNGRHVIAHRFSWQLINGKIPNGFCVCHKCDNPQCVNPNHLFLASHKENIIDSVRKGRAAQKLQVPDVLEIRQSLSDGLNYEEIAENYPVTAGAIEHIARGSTWGWLDE